MGGCYTSYTPRFRSDCERDDYYAESDLGAAFRKFQRDGDRTGLIKHFNQSIRCDGAGFIGNLAKAAGVTSIDEIPKEFSEWEYEVKFDIRVDGKGKEPDIKAFLNAFDFPATTSAHYLKDPVDHIAEGVNHFFGDGLEEKLVVIEKAGRKFLKKKGNVVPVTTGVPYEEIIVKRTEERYEATMEAIFEEARLVASEQGEYKGKIRKEKGDAFVLDLNDGRIYSFTINRSHLTRAGETKESHIQRQLELEYAGYIPKFPGFTKDAEEQIAAGMVDLAKFVWVLYNNAPIANGWRMQLGITGERKYDFVRTGKSEVLTPGNSNFLSLTEGTTKERKKAKVRVRR
ncbi:MAG: hypothetical protein ABIJ21_06795 [Nanoarchaeota archaeon]